MQAALMSLPTLGSVEVTTTSCHLDAQAPVSVVAGNAMVTGLGRPLSQVYAQGDWIRLADPAVGPVYTVLSLDTDHNTLLLSAPYSGPTASSVPLYYHGKDGYQYIVTFDSNLGDLPALSATATNTLYENNRTSSVYVTACDQYHTQLVTTSSSGSSPMNGSFALYWGSTGQATVYPGFFSGTNNQSSPATYGMMPYDVSASAMAQSIQNGFGSVYTVNVVRSTNTPAQGGGFTWTVTFIATDLAPLPMYADGHLLRGTGATVTVNTGYCPFTTQSRAGVVGQTSAYGVVGETFLAALSSGLPGDANHRAAQATITHVTSGLYSATYTSPRIGTYNLTVAKADRGGLHGLYYNNRWLYGTASETRLDSVLDFQWSTDDLITETGQHYDITHNCLPI